MMAHFLMQAIAGAARRRAASGTGDDGRLIADRMEYVDVAAATASGWKTVGTVGWGYTTAPAPLAGSARSLRLSAASQAVSKEFPAKGDLWVYMVVNIGIIASSLFKATLQDASGTTIVDVLSYTGGKWRAQAGGASNSDSDPGVISAGLTYHLWFHYIKGNGANAKLDIYSSIDGIRRSPLAHLTAGTSTTDAAKFGINPLSSGSVIVNDVIISTTEIGDNPTV